MPILTILVIIGWLFYGKMQARIGFDTVPDSKNLLTNPSFENWTDQNTVKEWQANDASKVQKIRGFNSRNGVRIENKDGKITTFDSPLIKTQPKQTYFFKTFYLTDTELNLVVQLIHQDGSSSYKLVRYLPDYDYPWSTMNGSVKPDGTVKAIRWRIVVLNKGFLELDSAYVVEHQSKKVAKAPISGNLISDYSTELTTENSKLEASIKNHHLQVKKYKSGQAELFLTTIEVKPNELYRFDFTYLASIMSELNIEVELNNGKYNYYEISENKPTNFWLTKSVEFETPNDAKSISIFAQLNNNGDFSIKPNYALYKLKDSAKFSEPKISITFDDGWLSSYVNGAKILEKYQMRGTFYIVPDLIGRNEYMNEEQLSDLAQRGHQIGSHTFDHRDLSMMDAKGVENELTKTNQYLRQRLKLDKIDLASPYGKIDSVGLKLVKKMQRSHRGTRAGVNTKQTLETYNLRTLFIDKEKSNSELLKKIELAKAFNGWLIVVYHQVEPNESFFAIEKNVFEEQIRAIQKSGVKVEKVEDVLRSIKKQKKLN